MKKHRVEKLSMGFFVVDGKLLYLSKEFIGYDPEISDGMAYPELAMFEYGTKSKEYQLTTGDLPFQARLTCNKESGPLRGYFRDEIFMDGKALIEKEKGCIGHGGNYGKGRDYCLENGEAFLVHRGHWLEYKESGRTFNNLKPQEVYLFRFKTVAMPADVPRTKKDGRDLDHNKYYRRKELESLIQPLWEAHIPVDGSLLKITKSGIPHCHWTVSDSRGRHKYSYMHEDYWVALERFTFKWADSCSITIDDL